jgi:thioredoxin reductase
VKSPLELLDAIIIGGGPSGLSAALLLGRCRRDVLLFDEGHPRNERAREVHAFLGLEDVSPSELLARGRRQLLRFPNVAFHPRRVKETRHEEGFFRIWLDDDMEFRSRTVLLATGLVDELPAIEGLDQFYGSTIHQCPYCDGWESSDQKIAVLGSGDDAVEYALEMLLWSEEVTLHITGEQPSKKAAARLQKRGIPWFTTPIVAVEGEGSRLQSLVLADGNRIPCERLFLSLSQTQRNDFVKGLGCKLCKDGQAECALNGATSIPGLYIAGNASKGIQLAMVAASEGLRAAAAINDWLLSQEMA